MKLTFGITILSSFLLFYFFSKNESEIRQKEFMERGQIILNVMELYKKKNGRYPDEVTCCFSNLKVTSKEMYIFPFDKDEKLAFTYEYDLMEKEYLLVIGDRYPPNLIFFTKTGKAIFDSDVISAFGL